MSASTEPNKGREAEKPTEPGKDAESRAPVSELPTPGSAAKATRPKSPREFIQERMRELDKKES
jgi:hypothetical protein